MADWSADPNEAWVFKDAADALAICRSFSLEDVEIVVAERESIYQFPVLAEHHEHSVRRWNSFPAISPETN